jgi:phosphatidylinositol alpha-1,6-mannosyltransferase
LRPRILLVTPEFPPQRGGIGTHSYEMARHWSEHADVTVLAPAAGRGGAPADQPFRLVELDAPRGRLVRCASTARAIRRQLAGGRYEVAYLAHWRASGVAYGLAAAGRRRRPRCVLAVHGGEVLYLLPGGGGSRLARWLFRWTAWRAATVVALGEYQATLLERLGVGRERTLVSSEGVSTARFDPPPTAERLDGLRRRYRLDGARILLTVARLVPHKGHDMVIRALPRIVERVPDAAYLVVGSGPHEAALRDHARRAGVAERVRFAGNVADEELADHYHLCDAFVMPSREERGNTEGFGIVFAEAAACARPAIGGRTGGVVEVIQDGRTGLLVDPTSPEEIAAAAVRLLTDRDLAGRLGAAARRRIEVEFRFEDVATRILAASLGSGGS